jgi:hypothetical protein
MTDSYRHTSILPVASNKGVKWYKKVINGKRRTKIRNIIKAHLNNGDYDNIDVGYEIIRFNEWDSPRDGKVYISKTTLKYINDYRKRIGKPPVSMKTLLGK